jgi:hypothetical protein
VSADFRVERVPDTAPFCGGWHVLERRYELIGPGGGLRESWEPRHYIHPDEDIESVVRLEVVRQRVPFGGRNPGLAEMLRMLP